MEDTNRTKLTEALVFMGALQYEDCDGLFEKVQACLQKLPEQQHRVFELKIFRDMSYREIAVELSLSEVTVHTHVKRAYKAIRGSLLVFSCLCWAESNFIHEKNVPCPGKRIIPWLLLVRRSRALGNLQLHSIVRL